MHISLYVYPLKKGLKKNHLFVRVRSEIERKMGGERVFSTKISNTNQNYIAKAPAKDVYLPHKETVFSLFVVYYY